MYPGAKRQERAAVKERKRSAFTLIELLTVVAIILVLMAMIVGIAEFARMAGLRAKARAEIERLHNALQEYMLEKGTYPQENPPRSITTNDLGPWLKGRFATSNAANRAVIVDPWNSAYVYQINQQSYTLYSLGPDKTNAANRIYSGK